MAGYGIFGFIGSGHWEDCGGFMLAAVVHFVIGSALASKESEIGRGRYLVVVCLLE